MSAISYMRRAVNRAIERGPVDMLQYSFSVVQNVAMNRYLDLRYGGRKATDRHTEHEKTPGVHGIFHTDWKFLNNTFRNIEVKPSDVLVDVGCGDGRVISYWLSRGFKNKIIGIELEKAAADDAAKRFAKFKNVEIRNGDAADLILATGGTLIYLFNPFFGETLERFAKSIDGMNARIVFYSYNDLEPFKNWRIEKFLETGQDPAYRFAILTPTTRTS